MNFNFNKYKELIHVLIAYFIRNCINGINKIKINPIYQSYHSFSNYKNCVTKINLIGIKMSQIFGFLSIIMSDEISHLEK